MPTAAKLIGALLLSGVGWLAALAAMQTFPDGMPARAFPPTIAAIGAWQGWVVIGGAAGQGLRAGLGQGLRAAVQMAVIGLAVFALREMFRRSANLRYDGPGDAAVAALDLFVQYGLQSLTVPIWGVVIAGGLMAGALTEWSARHWR